MTPQKSTDTRRTQQVNNPVTHVLVGDEGRDGGAICGFGKHVAADKWPAPHFFVREQSIKLRGALQYVTCINCRAEITARHVAAHEQWMRDNAPDNYPGRNF